MYISDFQVEFITINKGNPSNCSDFLSLGYEYMKEVASDYPLEVHEKFLNSILNKQGENERWLIMLKSSAKAIGFVHAKIDQDERVGLGYILEFYIIPDFRRKGFGIKLYSFIKHEFLSCEVKDVWLTADKINGEPFWFSIGFKDTGEVENGLKVLEISI